MIVNKCFFFTFPIENFKIWNGLDVLRVTNYCFNVELTNITYFFVIVFTSSENDIKQTNKQMVQHIYMDTQPQLMELINRFQTERHYSEKTSKMRLFFFQHNSNLMWKIKMVHSSSAYLLHVLGFFFVEQI